MAIVRGDRRADALVGLRTVRQMLEASMVQAAGGLAALDMLEVRLGLATADDVDGRSQYAVLHVPAGSKEGHELDECAGLGCEHEDPANAALLSLAGSLEDGGDGGDPGTEGGGGDLG